jgi:alkylresorcinol/alkylpyrone synthase
MSLRIFGIGCANPQHTMSQVEALQMAIDTFRVSGREERLLRVVFRKSGVENRYTSLHHSIATTWLDSREPGVFNTGPSTGERMGYFKEHAPPLASAAVERALENSQTLPAEVTHLVTISCTGFNAPGLDVDLIQQLGLPVTTQRVNVGFMGCHGAINGLRVAQGIVAANPKAVVLMCAVECCSVHYQLNWHPERSLGSALFGDGAAALVCRHDGSTRQGPHRRLRLIDTGSCLLPNSKDAITWNIGDHGFEMFLSHSVPELIEEHLNAWVASWLAQYDLEVQDIKSWAIHPGGPRIISSVESSLTLQPKDTEASREVLRNYGNMSSPTILFVLNSFLQSEASGPCVAIGFGPGIYAEAALLEFE